MDSKLFVHDLAAAYVKYAKSLNFSAEILHTSEGHEVLQINGRNVWNYFKDETGNHVVQRIPPTESKGRKQTSYVRVGVLPLKKESEYKKLAEKDLEITAQTGRQKAGGQNVNKVCSAIRAVHKPTGIKVFINGRDQGSNKYKAMQILTARVNDHYSGIDKRSYDSIRKNQLGDGSRGNKVRTYNFLESRVVDHITGKKTGNVKAVMKGQFELLK